MLAAATDAIANLSLRQKQVQCIASTSIMIGSFGEANSLILLCWTSSLQSAAHGILGGFIKGLKASKTDKNMDPSQPTGNHETCCANLESLFSNPPFLKPSTDVKDSQEPVMLNLGSLSLSLVILPSISFLFMTVFQLLGADDIVIDGPITVFPKDQKIKEEKKGTYAYQICSSLTVF